MNEKHAAAVLEALEQCPRIVPESGPHQQMVCRHDGIELVAFNEHWRHDPAGIRRLRAQVGPGWPNESESELRAAWGDR